MASSADAPKIGRLRPGLDLAITAGIGLGAVQNDLGIDHEPPFLRPGQRALFATAGHIVAADMVDQDTHQAWQRLRPGQERPLAQVKIVRPKTVGDTVNIGRHQMVGRPADIAIDEVGVNLFLQRPKAIEATHPSAIDLGQRQYRQQRMGIDRRAVKIGVGAADAVDGIDVDRAGEDMAVIDGRPAHDQGDDLVGINAMAVEDRAHVLAQRHLAPDDRRRRLVMINAKASGKDRLQRVRQRAVPDIVQQRRRNQQILRTRRNPGHAAIAQRQQRHADTVVKAVVADEGRPAVGMEQTVDDAQKRDVPQALESLGRDQVAMERGLKQMLDRGIVKHETVSWGVGKQVVTQISIIQGTDRRPRLAPGRKLAFSAGMACRRLDAEVPDRDLPCSLAHPTSLSKPWPSLLCAIARRLASGQLPTLPTSAFAVSSPIQVRKSRLPPSIGKATTQGQS